MNLRTCLPLGLAGVTAALLVIAPMQAPGQQKKQGAPLEERTGTTRVTWRTRTLVGNDRLLSWRTGPGAAAFPRVTFLESVARADELGMAAIEASSAQQVSSQIRKNLTYDLSAAEIAAVKDALKAANVQIGAYRVTPLTADRHVFDFAKALGAGLIIGTAAKESLTEIDKLATEAGVKVALAAGDPKTALAVVEGRKSIGIAADVAAWNKPLDWLSQVKAHLFAIDLHDRSASLTPLFRELNRAGVRPLFLSLEGNDMPAVIDGFEKGVQPALGDFVVAASKNMPIRTGDTLPADVKAKIDAAIPRTAYVQPKKPRKLLVIDACVANMSHNTIPHFNLAIELMGKYTGAFQPVFSNDLENLRWPKIKEWDAIYLNDTVGELFPDLDIRESLLRYVREGGGLGGWHGSPWASRSWKALGEMVSAGDGPHRIEPGFIKLDDPRSPINQAFDGTGLEHTEEYYRFHYAGPTAYYSRDKVHVLLSLDMDKSPAVLKPGRDGKPFFSRPDQDYAIAWIKSYGKGRIYYNSMGHMPETMMSKKIMGHVFAAIQFLVGDLQADTTPSKR
jgi:type 1 glutamine amidotransferase/sugar phosphate isomerase/epimerase